MNQMPTNALVLIGKNMLIRVAAVSAVFLLVFAPVAQAFAQETRETTPSSVEATGVTQDTPKGDPVILPPNPVDTGTPTDPVETPDNDSAPPINEVVTGPTISGTEISGNAGKGLGGNSLLTTSPDSLDSRDKSNLRLPLADESSGSLVYSYPITVIPGRTEITTPQIQLQYSSADTDPTSIFGYGWSVNIPYIKRINKTGVENLYSEDYYESSLSGELVLLSGSSYAPKVENGDFLAYDFSGTTWTVTDKTGTVYSFGLTSNSLQEDSSNIYKWMLEEVRDTNDNFISYTYTEDSGQLYPDTITYTGDGSTAGPFEVKFIPSTSPRADVMTTYASGFEITTQYVIDEIEISIIGAGNWLRKYELTYATGDNGVRTMLESITESGHDSTYTTTTSLEPIEFEYQVATTGTTLQDWDSNWTTPASGTLDTRVRNGGTIVADVNSDGLPDLLESFDSGTTYLGTYINEGDGTWTHDSSYDAPMNFMSPGNSPADEGVRASDVNGDGKVDLVQSFSNGGGQHRTYLNTGSGWTLDTNWVPALDFSNATYGDQGTRLADLNGDGLPDFFQAYEVSSSLIVTVYLNEGTGWSTTDTGSFWNIPVDLREGVVVEDVNNDGLPDFVKGYNYTSGGDVKETYINNGDGNWSLDTDYDTPYVFAAQSWGSTYPIDLGIRMADINGDNVPDLLKATNGGGGTNGVYLNTTKDWQVSTLWGMDSFLDFWGDDAGTRVGDFDGDGMLDFYNSRSSSATLLKNLMPKADLLSTVTTPTGGTIDITYKASALYENGGSRLNPVLPYNIQTVNTITTSDPVNSVSGTTTYTYEGGEYYYDSPTNRKLAGFATVTKTDLAGNVTKTYFHQGDPSNTANENIGDVDDTESKIGKPYRVEKSDDSSNFYEVSVMTWGEDQILSSDAYFVHQDSKTIMSYNGDNTHRDSMQTFSYDTGNGNLLEKIELGEVTANDDGSLNADVGTDDRTTQYEYAAPVGSFNVIGLPSHETVMENGGGPIKETMYYYDGQSFGDADIGNLTLIEKNTDGSVWSTITKAYTPWGGLVESETDPNSHTTTYSYDTYNLYPEVTTDALSWNITRTYDYATGKVIETTDKNTNVWTTTYDGFGRKLTEVIPMSAGQITKTEYTYDDSSSQKSITRTDNLSSSLSHATYTYLDGFGRAIQIRSEAESDYDVADTIYNGLGQIVSQSLPYNDSGSAYTTPSAPTGIITSYTYDPLGRIKSETHTSLGSTDYVYDDWQVTVTDKNGHDKVYYTDAYDNLIQVDEHSDVSTYETHYEWSMLGKLTKITDAENNIRNFTYDWVGNRLSAEDLHYYTGDTDFGTWNYLYDLAGNMIQSTDPRGMQIDYAYDELNRVLYENDPNVSGLEVEYVYDTACANGYDHLCIATGLNGVITEYSYFPEGTVETEAVTVPTTQYLTTYTYDYQGNVESIVYPNSDTVSYVYNTAGLLESIDHTPNGGSSAPIISDINYAPHGAIADETYGNAIITTNTYDSAKLYRLSHKVTTDSSTNLYQDISYTYDNVGNILTVDDDSNSNAQKYAEYQYDDLNRLMAASISGTPNSGATDYSQFYTYTGIGNFESIDSTSYAYNSTASGIYANPHAATTVGTDTLTYDEAGNLLDDSNNTYSWTYRNELAQATTPGGVIDYLYNHSGKRVQSNDTVTVTDTPNKFYETNGASPVDYIYAGSQLVANVDGNGTHYVHADHLTGSNVITDIYPKQEELLDYYPYGSIRLNEQTTSLDLKKKFTGHEHDNDTGLDYLNARYYEGSRGQFISQDPEFWVTSQDWLLDPQNQNSYAYARNNPINLSDPSGRSAVSNAIQGIKNAWNNLFGNNKVNQPQVIAPTTQQPTKSPTVKTTTWDPVSDQRIQQLDSRLQQQATNFINNTESDLNVQLRVVQGYRSVQEQNKLYAQGRTDPGNKVTNAKGGESYHNYGLAMDVVRMENGQPNWNKPITQDIANIGVQQGFSWGGSWNSFKDYPHFEMSFGQSIKSLIKTLK